MAGSVETTIKYEPVIGIEVHAQLETKSKIFCGCKVAFGEPPNSLTCPVCLGLPGALPVLNKKAVEFAMRMILAVGGTINLNSVFSRKNYFYPDLPKGYQISQFDKPIGEGGQINYSLDNKEQLTCRLTRIHIEEDAGKSLHPESGESHTRVDLNRSGTALIEIVSEPELASPEAAYAYLVNLKQILQYVGVCTGNMEKGHLRCDANVSVKPVGQKKLGTRTELKNMNSFKGVERALKFEINRQIALIQSGGEVQQATLLWNEKEQKAESMRSKEESHDYRYFPEPDLIDLNISTDWLEKVKASLPELPSARAKRFVEQYHLREYDARVLTDSRELADYYEEVMTGFDDAKAASNWIQTEHLKVINEAKADIANFPIKPGHIASLLKSVKSGEISGRIAKTVYAEMTKRALEFVSNISDATAPDLEPSSIIKKLGLAQISDETEIRKMIEKILTENSDSVTAYRNGKDKLFGFFVGQVMKASSGQANPGLVNKILKELLND